MLDKAEMQNPRAWLYVINPENETTTTTTGMQNKEEKNQQTQVQVHGEEMAAAEEMSSLR